VNILTEILCDRTEPDFSMSEPYCPKFFDKFFREFRSKLHINLLVQYLNLSESEMVQKSGQPNPKFQT